MLTPRRVSYRERVMKLEVTQLQCRIALTKQQWDRLEKLDYIDVVAPTLEKAGAFRGSVDYDGQFGRNLFFTADTKAEGEQVLGAVVKLLEARPRAAVLVPVHA